MKFHVVTGLPRSGSTLLTNILNQRPDTYASSTSVLPAALRSLSEILSNSPEETSRLENIPGTAKHHVEIGRSLLQSWHDTNAQVVFDKSRGWTQLALMLRSIVPDAGMIVTVRDPRDILASIERQNAKTAMYKIGKTLFDECNKHVAEDGIVGAPIKGVEDLIRRNLPNVYFVDYQALCSSPATVMAKIEATCQLEPHQYSFDNVESLATDLDSIYRNKFPHDASGPVVASAADWREVISDDIAKGTLDRWPLFCRTFGYSDK